MNNRKQGFSLVEVLVVVSIISVLIGILLPVLGKARQQAKNLIGMNNQKQVALTVNCFAMDNDDRYPESVATLGDDINWNWQAPFVLTSIDSRAPHLHRAMSEYLDSYIEDAGIMFCPNAPKKYKYLQQAWNAGDTWDNPDTWPTDDWVKGAYCFYWNYTGWLDEDTHFKGPRGPAGGGRGRSKLLMSDYFGFDNWRNEKVYCYTEAYGSCERIKRAEVTPGESISAASSAYWSRLESDGVNLDTIDLKLNAAYTDGHVETYSASEVVTMEVIKDRFTNEVYDYGPGSFYLPRSGVR